VVCANEIIAAMHNSDVEVMFPKLGFEKAFDSISGTSYLSY